MIQKYHKTQGYSNMWEKYLIHSMNICGYFPFHGLNIIQCKGCSLNLIPFLSVGMFVITRLVIGIPFIQSRIVIYRTTSSDNLLGALKIHSVRCK
jgi:hypothetical protein